MKKLALLVAAVFVLSGTVACTEPQTEPNSHGTDSSQPSSQSSAPPEPVRDPVPDLVMACNHLTGILGVYDMERLSPGDRLEDGLVWSTKHGEGADMKYREGTVFGDVIVTTGAGRAAMIRYPEGNLLWETTSVANNPHAIEILPSGNIIVASSTGNALRLFYTSALLDGVKPSAIRSRDVELVGAHGVLWDPEYACVWALGDRELKAYVLRGEGTKETLHVLNGTGAALPTDLLWGHDLSADYTDTRYLYLTVGSAVLRFDKDEGRLIRDFPQYAKLTRKNVKGFSNNRNGNFFLSEVNYGVGTLWEEENFAAWCTDRIQYAYWKTPNFLYVQQYAFEHGAMYKIRVFDGAYQ